MESNLNSSQTAKGSKLEMCEAVDRGIPANKMVEGVQLFVTRSRAQL